MLKVTDDKLSLMDVLYPSASVFPMAVFKAVILIPCKLYMYLPATVRMMGPVVLLSGPVHETAKSPAVSVAFKLEMMEFLVQPLIST